MDINRQIVDINTITQEEQKYIDAASPNNRELRELIVRDGLFIPKCARWADLCLPDLPEEFKKIDRSLFEIDIEDEYNIVVDEKEEEQHELKQDWSFWFHSIKEKDWGITGFKRLAVVHTVEEFSAVLRLLPRDIDNGGFIYLMRGDIQPRWEDKRNVAGGFQNFLSPKANTKDTFIGLCKLLVSGELFKDDGSQSKLTGISCTIKKIYPNRFARDHVRGGRGRGRGHIKQQRVFKSATFDVVKFWMNVDIGKLPFTDAGKKVMPKKEAEEGLSYRTHKQ